MDILAEHGFDPEKFILGSLCKRGHEFQGTGGSLRYKHANGKAAGCTECRKLNAETFKQNQPQQTEKFILGSLCKRRHEFESTGQSLRYAKGTHQCVQCSKENGSDYRSKHPDKIKEYSRQYYEANREAFLEYRSRYYRANTEKIKEWRKRPDVAEKHRIQSRRYARMNQILVKERNKKWRESNKDYLKLKNKEYRSTERGKEACRQGKRAYFSRKRKVHSSPISPDALLKRAGELGDKCSYCNGKHESWDHFIPVSQGGSDVIGNLVPCCKLCNSAKRNQDPLEWYQRQPFYSEKQWKKILRILGKTPETYNQIPLL